ncbi:class I SAM-dependent methyltransferase [Pseudonocardia sp. DSM 110487]|uniref:class I SAM-dependent methyltransferase n=1 Tax=Pseudonocardia sp. DSM 110487 TaxID=2865833 RepID=UPI001C6A5345|nr:class I SAM-dependent methyltransferase [Pseudonocardia sp. DSM 110487]QYN35509.1 class I SAM-dependent methyltransferase [Pseudonocardia sp. DSM 110487]
MTTSSRARSFGAAAAAYAEHRPGYPAAAVDWALEPVADGPLRLLDLAAGTGKLTEGLLSRGAVTAVEPDPAMLSELRARFPTVEALEGNAEAIPLPDASIDAVLVGQAWHWFDADRAFAELARVLRPGGVLAVLWNDDARVNWTRGMYEAARWDSAGASPADGEPSLPAHPAFAPGGFAQIANPIRTTVDGLIASLRTRSFALTRDPAEREAIFDRIRAYLAARPETASGEFTLPLVTDVVRVVRR